MWHLVQYLPDIWNRFLMVYNFSHTGLIYGFSENKKCLEKFLGMYLNDRTDDTYTSYPIAAEALDRNEVIIYIIKYFLLKHTIE